MTSERLVVCASHSPGKERDVERAFGRRFRSALTSAAERAQQFDPDVVVVFGGDHRRAFRHVVPAFGVALSASIRTSDIVRRKWRGDSPDSNRAAPPVGRMWFEPAT